MQDKENLTMTIYQRRAQRQKLKAAIELLELAVIEAATAEPGEIAQTVDVALEIIASVNRFLQSR